MMILEKQVGYGRYKNLYINEMWKVRQSIKSRIPVLQCFDGGYGNSSCKSLIFNPFEMVQFERPSRAPAH